ncbi:Cinnamoyl-CoA reductase 1 [Bienertia sinuspersici]
MSGEGKVVCVTGASGYVASWIVKLLLQRGYTVKATVRNPNDPKKVEHLLSLEGANERLHLLAANLLEEGSFDAAVEGCEGAELLDPAVKGTLNVLNSCAKFSSIKRVVLTSSTAAVACNGKPLSAEVVVDENVATAHILALEVPSANGRYCVSEIVTSLSEIVKVLREIYPDAALPEKCAEDENPLSASYQMSNKKAQSLGIDFIPFKTSLKETVESLKEKGEEKVVCVTGASGYIASWLVKLLLQRGYTVKATIRDLNGAKERLHLFAANLLEEGSFDAAVEGCEGVFHTASPLHFGCKDPQAEFIDPAVKGTLNVLTSCAKVPSIKRVVLTSSVAAVLYNGKPLGPEVVVDESWFSDPDFCREKKEWYPLSKILAEDVAWKFVEEKGIDMVIINPAIVIGPLLQPTLNASSSGIVELFNGSEAYPNTTFGWVHVKDVANAHILAFEVPSANGRYCLVGTVAHFSETVKILKELYPNAKLPEKCAEDDTLAAPFQVSQEKAKSLGISYTPFKTSLKETIDCLIEKGFISF